MTAAARHEKLATGGVLIALCEHRRPVSLAMESKRAAGLFERLVAESGLASVIAAPAMRRALSRAGVNPATMTGSDLQSALSFIETSLHVYLPPEHVAQRMKILQELVASLSS